MKHTTILKEKVLEEKIKKNERVDILAGTLAGLVEERLGVLVFGKLGALLKIFASDVVEENEARS